MLFKCKLSLRTKCSAYCGSFLDHISYANLSLSSPKNFVMKSFASKVDFENHSTPVSDQSLPFGIIKRAFDA